ncbi:MAG: DUF1254 domain-containing protein [Planctomycetota bacterium]|nr:DUF1254 domain-containing protein [Planctomycetota bacterium]
MSVGRETNRPPCEARVYTPDDKAIVTPSFDTPYCMIWMDIGQEPLVLRVPELEPATDT